jgi:hypothetical protein
METKASKGSCGRYARGSLHHEGHMQRDFFKSFSVSFLISQMVIITNKMINATESSTLFRMCVLIDLGGRKLMSATYLEKHQK